MKAFADTFYWIALTDPKDKSHDRARRITRDIVTTDEVLTEYLNFFVPPRNFFAERSLGMWRMYYRIRR